MRYSIFIWALVIYLFSQLTYSQSLSEKINTLIKKELPHATVGILIKDAQTGQIIYTKNADKLLSPASNIKLFTAAAALYQLDPGVDFSTTLSQKNQNFYLTFNGSPSLTIKKFTDLLLNLKKNNIKTINGNIILDISHFKAPYYPSGISYDDLGWYYSAPDTAIMLNENAETYQLISASKPGMLATIKPKTTDPKLKIINQVITVNKEQKKQCSLNIEIKSENTIRLFGCMGQMKQPKEIQLALPDPVFLAKQIITQVLHQENIILKGDIVLGQTPPDASLIASVSSDNLNQLISHMLKESDNLYASSITRQLAYSLDKEGSLQQGIATLKEILEKYTNLDMTQIELADGLGSRYNLVTPEQIVLLLTTLYQDKQMFPTFLTALPQAGISGTLKDRMKKTILEHKIYAKTGTMHDVSSLSGYLINQNHNPLIFSIVINGVNKPISVAKSLEEQILLMLAENIDKPVPTSETSQS
jgi:D-alanyl-D-alanine carboxypeptidase/D-alanyl-D-alanine-endopeptidase (penicillin-binding protein 4)